MTANNEITEIKNKMYTIDNSFPPSTYLDLDITMDDTFIRVDDTWFDCATTAASNIATILDNTSDPITLGEDLTDKHKIYIVEPWQSRRPIKIKEGFWISLERDLISNEEIKSEIIKKLEETDPDILIRAGINRNNIKLVKSEVNIEINKEFNK